MTIQQHKVITINTVVTCNDLTYYFKERCTLNFRYKAVNYFSNIDESGGE